jgi:hypothetical protein
LRKPTGLRRSLNFIFTGAGEDEVAPPGNT